MAPRNTVRTPIPKNPGEQIKLAGKVYAKHQADGASSPLTAIEEWPAVGPTIAQAADYQNQIDDMELALEKLYESRDNLLGPIVDVTPRSRGVLGSVYKNAPRTLGDWGYTVDDTPAKPAAKKTSS